MTKFLTRWPVTAAAALLILIGTAYFWLRPKDSISLLYQSEKLQLSIKGTYLSVEVADTAEKHQRGLSKRPSLANGEGMLFVYDQPLTPSFWMKDMNFSIDIIWIGEDKKIVFIHHNVIPDTFPQTFSPPSPVKYVLEVQSGFSKARGISSGDIVNF